MQLSFLGQAYEAPTTPGESFESEQTASFMGKKYKMQQHSVHARSAATALTYRGARYSR